MPIGARAPQSRDITAAAKRLFLIHGTSETIDPLSGITKNTYNRPTSNPTNANRLARAASDMLHGIIPTLHVPHDTELGY